MPALSPARDVGVQSWSFREFKDNQAFCDRLKAVGVSASEICGVHATFDDPAKHQAPIDVFRRNGIRVCSIGVQTFTGNVAVERQWFEFAKAAGARYISAHFKVDSYREAIKAASAMSEIYGIRLALHCHGGYMFGGSADVIDHILKLGGPYVGLNIDTAWCMQAAGKPVEWVKRWPTQIYGVHYKDFVFDRAGKWTETVIGEGNLPLADLVKALEDNAFAGFAVIEYEAEPQDPTASIRRCVEKIRALA